MTVTIHLPGWRRRLTGQQANHRPVTQDPTTRDAAIIVATVIGDAWGVAPVGGPVQTGLMTRDAAAELAKLATAADQRGITYEARRIGGAA